MRVRLTEKGRAVRSLLQELFTRHAEALERRAIVTPQGMEDVNQTLKRMERYWTEQIRYIY